VFAQYCNGAAQRVAQNFALRRNMTLRPDPAIFVNGRHWGAFRARFRQT
jgi:hypothetical protein